MEIDQISTATHTVQYNCSCLKVTENHSFIMLVNSGQVPVCKKQQDNEYDGLNNHLLSG